MGTMVCAVDDSPEAEEALRVAARLSGDASLRLVVAHVEEQAGSSDRIAAEQRGRQLLDRLLSRQGLSRADRRVEVGERADALARVAEEEAASVIVVGSRSARWWRRRRTGSLTSDLAATAACPVVVVPPAARR